MSHSASLSLHYISHDASAVCADGTPAGYYYAQTSQPEQEQRWIVMLDGGVWCYDSYGVIRICIRPSVLYK